MKAQELFNRLHHLLEHRIIGPDQEVIVVAGGKRYTFTGIDVAPPPVKYHELEPCNVMFADVEP